MKKAFLTSLLRITPVIQNVVTTVDFNVVLDLRKVALKAKNTEYNPKRFHALIIRSREPKTTAMIFKTGKMVVTGAKNLNDSKKAVNKFHKIVKQSGYQNTKVNNFRIRNLVASCDFRCHLNLEAIAYSSRSKTMYETEIFPGLIYRPGSTGPCAILFSSGKVVLTGLKSMNDLKRLHNIVTKLCIEHHTVEYESDK